MATLYPVILSGGSGTRLWPVSRALFPKQLLALTGENTMLQETALRVRDGEGHGEGEIRHQAYWGGAPRFRTFLEAAAEADYPHIDLR